MDHNPLTNAKIAGVEADPSVYNQNTVRRGEPGYTMSRSSLSLFNLNPHKWVCGYREEATDAMEWGNLIDTLVLQPQKFGKRYAITPSTYPATPKTKGGVSEQKPWTRKATYCEEWETEMEMKGLTVLSPKDYQKALDAKAALLADERVRDLLDTSVVQMVLTAEYRDKATGLVVPLKMLLDLVPDKGCVTFGKCLADLKTTDSAAPRAWSRSVHTYWLHAQAAMYLDAFTLATGEDRTDFYHVIQESYAPYEICRRFLSQEFISLGRATYLEALARYARCVSLKQWPGYDEDRPVLQHNGWTITEPEPWMLNP